MGIMVYSLLWIMQGLYHQPYEGSMRIYRGSIGLHKGSIGSVGVGFSV